MRSIATVIAGYFKRNTPSRTVKYMFPVMLSSAVVLTASVITSGEQSYVRLEPSASIIQTGDDFYIDIYASSHVPVNAVDIILEYDQSIIDVTAVDVGRSVITLWTEKPVFGNGKVELRGGTYRRGFIQEHYIARVKATAIKTGPSKISARKVIFLAGDGAGTNVPVAETVNTSAEFYVYDENTDMTEIVLDNNKLPTDIDGDGEVTLKDMSMFMSAWQKRDRLYDFDGDGKMTLRDFSIILTKTIIK